MKTLFFVLSVILITTHARANMCSSSLSITSSRFDENFDEIQAVLAASMQRQQLLDAEITFSALGLGAGRSKLFLEVVDGRIVNLNIDTQVRMAGINFDRMQTKLNINDFSSGRPLSFKMEGAQHPALVITPGSGFNSRGGRLSIKTWTGNVAANGQPIYSESTLLYISADQQGRYSLYKSPNFSATPAQIAQARNRVTGLKINMRGNPASTRTLYAHNYRITTQGS